MWWLDKSMMIIKCLFQLVSHWFYDRWAQKIRLEHHNTVYLSISIDSIHVILYERIERTKNKIQMNQQYYASLTEEKKKIPMNNSPIIIF